MTPSGEGCFYFASGRIRHRRHRAIPRTLKYTVSLLMLRWDRKRESSAELSFWSSFQGFFEPIRASNLAFSAAFAMVRGSFLSGLGPRIRCASRASRWAAVGSEIGAGGLTNARVRGRGGGVALL